MMVPHRTPGKKCFNCFLETVAKIVLEFFKLSEFPRKGKRTFQDKLTVFQGKLNHIFKVLFEDFLTPCLNIADHHKFAAI